MRDDRVRDITESQLGVGLFLYGVSIALVLSAGLGVDSWDVFHTGG